MVFIYIILSIIFGIIGSFLPLLFGITSDVYAILGGITGLLIIPIYLLDQILLKI